MAKFEIDGFEFEVPLEGDVPEGAKPVEDTDEDEEEQGSDAMLEIAWSHEEALEVAAKRKKRQYKGPGTDAKDEDISREAENQKKKTLKMNIKDIQEYRDKYCGAPIKQKQSSETEDSE